MADLQRLISNCGNEIRKLADIEKHLQAFMTDLRSSMTRLDTFIQRADDKQWSDLDKLNAKIQEECQHAAVQLSAAIEVYLSMQDDVTEEDVSDMITELNALKTQLNSYQLDQHDSLRILIAHATQVADQQSQAVQERSVVVSQEIDTANAAVSALQKQLHELQSQHSTTTQRIITESTTGVTSFLSSFRSKSKPRDPAAAAPLGSPDKSYGRTQQAMDAQDRISGHLTDSRALEDQIRAVQGQLAEAQQRYDTAQNVIKIMHRADWESTRSRMGVVIDYLKEEDQQMNALPELRKQLLNEVNAYLAAFEGLKAYPGPERQEALKNMQQRVSATAPAWKRVEGLLTDEYAKGRK
ncbi:uncharacterized protein TRAVEDRAFT_73832 [Trametes versicolor FP-101664 SS1]|uniref:uncharacterized protein n=1 Tax=Trametes versicolor (strain FP-101664) TaxID=717944 RepID=UPI00046215F1|nr:uncharacterized protein TRAVEDRAFT_73832 [Trametes versicolor FP-101664 SS1]EIW54642.1 hypothetical protein TRAVEDRAFT_73832 [Trametes versicolor FP-101664 SS1]